MVAVLPHHDLPLGVVERDAVRPVDIRLEDTNVTSYAVCF